VTDEQKLQAEKRFHDYCQRNGITGAEKILAHAKANPREFLAVLKPICGEIEQEIAEEQAG
jgi:hypothetical protein